MSLQRIKQRVSGGGFKPFRIRTSDGHEYAIRHPEWVLVGGQGLAVLDADGEIAWVNPLHIVAIKDLPAAKNGHAKK